MRKNPVLENEMKRYTRNMKCAWIILGVNLVLALFALIAQMGLSGRENYMTILQYRFPIQCYVLMGYGLFLAICILIPGLAGGSIAGERERKTLDLLLTTHLSPWKIILGKLESSLCLIFLISFSTLPVIGLVLIYGGITLVNLFQLILNLVILLQKLDREETLLLLRNAVQLCCYTIDHGLYFRCKFMYGMECVLLLCDGYCLLCRLLDTGTLQGRNLNNLAAETLAQLICVDLVAILLYDIHHVDCHDHRNAELHDLCGQIQVTLKVCTIYDVDDRIWHFIDQVISGYYFLKCIWGK